MTEDPNKYLLSEYENAHSSFHHYDGFRWQSGSILVAAAVVLWGFLFSGEKAPTVQQVGVAGAFITTLLSCWMFYAHHYRQLYMSKLYRIHQIEYELGMKLNTQHGFLGLTKVERRIYGPKGHNIDIAVYVLVSMFGSLYWFVANDMPLTLCSWLYLFLWLPVVLATIFLVRINEKQMFEAYGHNPPGAQQSASADAQEAARR